MGLYTNYWIQVLPAIKEKLATCDEKQKLALDEEAFNRVGNRKSYSFNLEFKDTNTSETALGGSAVARDLAQAIESDAEAIALIRHGHFKLNMDKNFALWIKKI